VVVESRGLSWQSDCTGIERGGRHRQTPPRGDGREATTAHVRRPIDGWAVGLRHALRPRCPRSRDRPAARLRRPRRRLESGAPAPGFGRGVLPVHVRRGGPGLADRVPLARRTGRGNRRPARRRHALHRDRAPPSAPAAGRHGPEPRVAGHGEEREGVSGHRLACSPGAPRAPDRRRLRVCERIGWPRASRRSRGAPSVGGIGGRPDVPMNWEGGLVVKTVPVADRIWEIPPSEKSGMLVPARIYASEALLGQMDQGVFDQVTNVACLPGIVRAALCMPDGHWGYGFPIGGVAAFRADSGIISPGGIGFDINCGMRLLRTRLRESEGRPRLSDLTEALARAVPSGVGAKGFVHLPEAEFNRVMVEGAGWCVTRGYGWPEDLDSTEGRGCLPGADPSHVSARAVARGMDQLGTLGSGNHYLELQTVPPAAVH